MSQYPNSPYGRASQAVAELNEGQLSADDFLGHLEMMVHSLDNWKSQLDSIRSDDYAEGRELIDDARESLQAIYDGVELLRDFAETRAPEAAAEGLELLAEASDFLAQLLDITEQNMENLEDER
jgi:exonuclease VII small subunit